MNLQSSISESVKQVNPMSENTLDSLLHLLRYLIFVDKSWQCSRSRCRLCPYFSLNNGYEKNCSELKDTEKLAIICREAEKITFEEGEYHDLQEL